MGLGNFFLQLWSDVVTLFFSLTASGATIPKKKIESKGE
jgi:hypothetical protein